MSRKKFQDFNLATKAKGSTAKDEVGWKRMPIRFEDELFDDILKYAQKRGWSFARATRNLCRESLDD